MSLAHSGSQRVVIAHALVEVKIFTDMSASVYKSSPPGRKGDFSDL
jgi:hypothetical protein